MGITSFSIQLLDKALALQEIKTVCELGSQNLYDKDYGTNFPYAHEFYNKMGIVYSCIDLNGENGALILDLGKPQKFSFKFDLVTDFGTSEHVSKEGKHNINAFYNCLKSKHELLCNGGIMISENPKTGNWPGHGFNYYSEDFYKELIIANGYELIELGEHPAMGNTTDGWNIYCIFRKINDKPFMSLKDFKKLPILTE